MQKVFIGVSRNIGNFHYDRTKCSFKHWLSQMVQWRIRDRLRERLPIEESPHRDEDSTDGCEDDGSESVTPELEAAWEAEWRRNLIEVASDRVRKQVSPKQFQIYYLHVLNELPVADVVRRLHVSPAQVYLARLRVGRVFRSVVKTLQAADRL
jgi:RNA polymerase sigma factor (sigma-70 family)